jgi:hypothetical protein
MSSFRDEDSYELYLEPILQELEKSCGFDELVYLAFRSVLRIYGSWGIVFPGDPLLEEGIRKAEQSLQSRDSDELDDFISRISKGVDFACDTYEEHFPCMDLSQSGNRGLLLSNARFAASAAAHLLIAVKELISGSEIEIDVLTISFCLALCWAASGWSDDELNWQKNQIDELRLSKK